MSWNYGDMLDAVAAVVPPSRWALADGRRVITWAEFDRHSNRLAHALWQRGSRPGDKVAFYMRNRPEYVEGVSAVFKARLVHVNINYRYVEEELYYILTNLDVQTIFYDAEFAAMATRLRPRLAQVATWVQVGDGGSRPDFAEAYTDLINSGDTTPLDIERSPDDQFLICTGGTTGLPKGVLWRVDDLRQAQLQVTIENTAPRDLGEHIEMVVEGSRSMRALPASPFMHGTGLFSAINTIVMGGMVVTMDNPSFDPHEFWQLVDRYCVQHISFVGDAFARPLLAALRERPGAYDLSSLLYMTSSGTTWSVENKRAFLELIPQVTLYDSLGASEANNIAISVMNADREWQTGKFELAPQVRVLAEDGREIHPGSGEPGLVAITGPLPIGYYKDPDASARLFRTFGGERYVCPGDWCLVEADGTLTFLGRGSLCINTGGEKVYPEEVEEVVRRHPDVEDALVVGVPDVRWGEAVTAVVRSRDGAAFDETALRAHTRNHLARFKTPKRFLRTTELIRAPNGKADYRRAMVIANKHLGLEPVS